jgi:hypothetical protein
MRIISQVIMTLVENPSTRRNTVLRTSGGIVVLSPSLRQILNPEQMVLKMPNVLLVS